MSSTPVGSGPNNGPHEPDHPPPLPRQSYYRDTTKEMLLDIIRSTGEAIGRSVAHRFSFRVVAEFVEAFRNAILRGREEMPSLEQPHICDTCGRTTPYHAHGCILDPDAR